LVVVPIILVLSKLLKDCALEIYLTSFIKLSVCALFFVVVSSFCFSSYVFGFLSFVDGDLSSSFEVVLVAGAKDEKKAGKRAQLEGFVRLVLSNSHLFWQKKFVEMKDKYVIPEVVFFKDKISSPCGNWHLEMGPFYCNIDETIYFDVFFFEILETKFGAPGKFAQAYVVAHEVGHHVQNLLHITGPVKFNRSRWVMIRSRLSSLRLELQADCFAGLWARYAVRTTEWLKVDQFDEGLRAATQVGDDFVLKNIEKRVITEAFAHGTSKQRSTWFKRGFDGDDFDRCDSFKVDDL